MIRAKFKSKPRRCINPKCNREFTPTISSTQKVCSKKCAIAVTKQFDRVREKNRAIIANADRQRMREMKSKIETTSDLQKKLQQIVNAIARSLDIQSGRLNCISCGQFAKKPQGGHFHSVKANNTLRFHLDNIHLQCVQCNEHEGGNIIEYHSGLSNRYGRDYADWVKYDMVAKYPSNKMNRDDLRMAIVQARAVLAAVKIGYIKTRNQANYMLNIYK